MALIKCPECGKEISDKAKKCIYCGFVLKKGTLGKRKIKYMAFASVVILALVVCIIIQKEKKKQQELEAQRQQEIVEIDAWVQKVYKGEIPSQKEYDEMMERLHNIGEDEIIIENADTLKRFETVDLDNIVKISNEIAAFDESSEFTDILEIKKQFESLNENERELIDINKLESLMELSPIENASLAACKNIQSCMISEEDFKISEITVKDDLEEMNFYWVLIKYSGTNRFGGNIDKTSCFGIDSDFKDPFFGLAQITGVSKYLDSTVSYNEYTKSKKQEISVDVDKITYYLEKE